MNGDDVRTEVCAYWDRRAPAFDGVASHVAQAEVWRGVLGSAFQAEAPKDVVDLGTGTGACALIAAELGHGVRACDGSEGMLAVARRAAQAAGLTVSFEQALIEDWPIAPASADIVTLRNVLWTLPHPSVALSAAHRILRPGGLVLVSDGVWSVAPSSRSTYDSGLAARLPFHGGLGEDEARELLTRSGLRTIRSWQHLFPASPYPGRVPMFVLTGVRP